MPQEHEQPVRGVGGCGFHDPSARRAHRCARRHGDVDPGVRLGRVPWPHLTARDEAGDVQWPVGRLRGRRFITERGRRWPGAHGNGTNEIGRHHAFLAWRAHPQHGAQLLIVRLRAVESRGELLHAAILFLESCHPSLQNRYARRRATDRSRKREEQHHQQPDAERAPLTRLERPEGDAILARRQLPIDVHDDGDAPILALRHPSNGAPRISSRSRARSSFE